MKKTALRPVFSSFSPRRIAVFRALMFGDVLCAIPAVRALRHACPHAHITLVGLPWAREMVSRFSKYFDQFLVFPGFPGMAEREVDIAEFPQFLLQAQHARFDFVLQLHGSGQLSNPVSILMGGRVTAGFYDASACRPNPGWFFPYPGDLPEIRRNLRLVELLGIPTQGEALEFPVTAVDEASFHDLPGATQLSGEPFVCVHPGARFESRRWPCERFAQLADALANAKYRIVITGSAAEIGLANTVQQAMQAEAINLAGQTSLGTLAVLLKRCALLVCNDTGVSHLAAALRVPSVVIVAGSDPARWAPLNRQLHRVVSEPTACRPCPHEVCPIGLPCAEKVTVERVAAASLSALGDAACRRATEQDQACAGIGLSPP